MMGHVEDRLHENLNPAENIKIEEQYCRYLEGGSL